MSVRHIIWEGKGLLLLDQRRLPEEEAYVRCDDARQVAEAIKAMVVRGAPALGIVAALGVALEAARLGGEDLSLLEEKVASACELLRSTRPTARNLFWALERMEGVLKGWRGEGRDLPRALEEEALRIWSEDVEANRTMGCLGAELLPQGSRVLTHCNAGALATGGYGTALGLIRRAHEEGRVAEVFASETRPLLQGARLTAWELSREGIPVSVITDNAAGHLMQRGQIGAVVVGADRITARGDTANKIGTYPLAVLARGHGIPFYVVAPSSTFDLSIARGDEITIEERDQEEVLNLYGRRIAPHGVRALNPAFDVTPAELITAIVTEKGIIWPPLEKGIRELLG
ncbi:MAG: S-methyl-5-thioribose-1-phosphate isomerase [Deltaproteobacteria bacterium]|nr:MAG: S-methyl-5-thioribose-1-phosphate isomerase [Deltaproteobacteria bacterium]